MTDIAIEASGTRAVGPTERLRRRRRLGAWVRLPFMLIWGLIAVVLGLIGFNLAIDGMQALQGDPTAPPNTAIEFAVVAGAIGLTAALTVAPYTWLYRGVRPRRTLLWLRRFHLTGRAWFPIDRALDRARRFIVAPLTIRDPRMAADRSGGAAAAAAVRTVRWTVVFALALVALVLVAVGFFVDTEEAGFKGLPGVLGLVLAVVMLPPIGAVWFGLRWIEARIGYDVLPRPPEKAVADLEGYFRTVDRGRQRPAALHIFKAHDDNWQAVVAHAIARADLVFLDVSEITDNVAWEITSVFAAKPPERVVFALLAGDDGAADPAILQRLEDLIGADALARAHRVVYPASRVQGGWRRPLRDVTKALRGELSTALDQIA